MRSLLFTALFSVASQGFAQACHPEPITETFELRMNYLKGTYDIVGKDPATQKPYVGRMQVEVKNNTLIFERTVNGKTLTGKGRYMLCTADDIPAFEVQYPGKTATLIVGCRLSAGFDNDPRATCNTVLIGPKRVYGLEAWFFKS